MRHLPRLSIFAAFATVQAFAQITLNSVPTRVIGQTSVTISGSNPNLVEGREFLNPQGIAIDLSMNPPALYVSDTGNNRVLGFRNATGFANGMKADLVLGQPDLLTTIAQGPGRTNRSTGTDAPTGVAVDSSGNVYIVDSGNNRILRFPRPFTNSGDQLPDLVIGQTSFAANVPNQGGLSASTLALSNGTTTFQAYLTFDSAGNLWVADAGNNRVLRFPVAALNQGAPGPAADLVLGQTDFITNAYTPIGTSALATNALGTPTGIAFDTAGRLFVSESIGSVRGRIIEYNPPFSTGQRASRLLAVDLDSPQPPAISELQLSQAPGGLFTIGNQIGSVDTFNNRLLIFPPVDSWDATTTHQPAIQVIGQKDFNSGSVNQGQVLAGASTLARPSAAVAYGNEIYIVDSLNHRVVVTPTSGGPATRVLGQDALDLNTANLIEGREFNFGSGEGGLAVDINSNPPRLYVADTGNNRILGFKDLRNLQAGAKADIVIGQPDFQHGLVNYPTADSTKTNQSGLFGPTGLYVDSDGNLYVADTGNSRVLRFRKPFDNYKPNAMQNADLVLGQLNFFNRITDPSSRTMAAPYGLAQASEHGLLVSDVVHNRVLYFPGTTATFTNGQAATIVFGQRDFNSSSAGDRQDQLEAPRHIATDSDDRLYIADFGNDRVQIFDHAPTTTNGSFAAVSLSDGISAPHAVHVGPVTGDIWVASTGMSTAIRFPPFNKLPFTNSTANATLSSPAPRALTEDAWGNIFIADAANRVVIHYPALSALNAANYLGANVLAPGMITALYSRGNTGQFGGSTDAAKSIPLPKQLNGVQVLFNNVPTPLFFASADQINFQVPIGAPQSGLADLQVIETATGRLLGNSAVAMTPVQPGLFTQAANGSGTAIAANKDGKLNTADNPAIAGDFITFYGTGQGFVEGAPADGDVSNKPLPTPHPPTVAIGGEILTGPDVQYGGLAPGLVGVWQVNAKIPKDLITLPGNPTRVLIIQDSVPSADARLGRTVQIYVKQP